MKKSRAPKNLGVSASLREPKKEEDKPALVPKLRFPEFRNAESWKESTIGGVCKLKAGEFVSATDIEAAPTDGRLPCYGGNGLRGYVRSFTHDGTYVLVGRQGALCGNVNLFHGKFHATEHALVVTPHNGFSTNWLYYALGVLNLNRFSIGQAQPGLSVGVLNNVALATPSDEAEQQKIAECLSSVDELMAAQVRKVDALKTHKKGLMQQLFPREGETQPRLRFPEFQTAVEWAERRLDELVDIQSGATPSKANPAFWNGCIPWVSAKT